MTCRKKDMDAPTSSSEGHSGTCTIGIIHPEIGLLMLSTRCGHKGDIAN